MNSSNNNKKLSLLSKPKSADNLVFFILKWILSKYCVYFRYFVYKFQAKFPYSIWINNNNENNNNYY